MSDILNKLLIVLLLTAAFIQGCKQDSSDVKDKVVILSPHSDNIKYEIEKGFKAYYLDNYGKEASIDWRNIGSGGSGILSYIRNVYSRSETCGIDIFFGAGNTPHQYLADEGLLEQYQPKADYLAATDAVFSGSRMYDKDHLWHGVVLSSFGILYNKQLLKQLDLTIPGSWEDLGKSEYHNHIILADPSLSSSIATTYEMIVQSEADWQHGWSKLLNILGNAKKFTAGSSTATNATVIGEAVIAACIDYYGALAVQQSPDDLGYISPKAGTGFTPDPISILKNPPNKLAATRFVDYVLSFEGQALWALMPTHPLGPEKTALNRSPIRKDFYDKYADNMADWLVKPYSQPPMEVDESLRSNRYDVIIELVKAAAIDNASSLSQAKKIIDSKSDQNAANLFYTLPENVDSNEKIMEIHNKLSDDVYRQQLRRSWSKFFRDKYAAIIKGS